MAYTDLNSVKISLGIAPSNTQFDPQLNQFIAASTAAITKWLGRDLHFANRTEIYKGTGYQYLALVHRPVTCLQKAGTLTNASAVVTAIDTTGLVPGMAVVGTNPTPVNNPSSPAITPGTTILTVDSGSQITLSAPANTSSTQTLFFGCAVWVDSNAYWGQASQAFAPQTSLTPGVDFSPDIDSPDGTSQSGLLYSIGGWWPIIWNYTPGVISLFPGPANGNIKVSYTAGYRTIPADVQTATNMLVARLRQVSQYGQAIQTETVKDYSVTFVTPELAYGLITPEIGGLLASYRNQTF